MRSILRSEHRASAHRVYPSIRSSASFYRKVRVDIKKLGRIARIGHRITGNPRDHVRGVGWEYAHVCVDDCSRLAYAEVLPDERGVTIAGFMRRAVAWFGARGILVQRVLSDNGSGYISRVFAAACRRLRLVHRRTPTVYAPHQRRSRALHSDAAARMGLRAAIPEFGRAHRRARALAALLQRPPRTPRPQRTTTHQQTRPVGRSPESAHLDASP